MSEELADIHAAEAPLHEVIAPVEADAKPPSLRETLNKSIEEVREKERSRDEQGKFAKEKPVKAAPEKVETLKESLHGDERDDSSKTSPQQASKPAGAPPGWSTESKAFFDSLPPDHPLRQDVAKREEEVSNGFKSYSEKTKQYDAIEQVLAPNRARFQQFGVKSDAEAVNSLMQWEASFANPQTRTQAFQQLARTYGVDLSQFARSPATSDGSQEIPEHLRPVLDQFGQISQKVTSLEDQLQQREQERVRTEIAAFAKDKPHFDKVRIAMGQMMTAGLVAPNDLEGAYQRAIWADPDLRDHLLREQDEKRKAEFAKTQLEAGRNARLAAVSPAPRARQAAAVNGADKSSKGVRGSIMAAVNEVQERNRA